MGPSAAARRVVAGAALSALAAVCPQVSPAADLPRLEVRLIAVTALADDVRAVLLQEMQRLWGGAGIRVAWTDAASSLDTAPLRVLVVTGSTPVSDSGHAWPVAELLHDTDGRPMAIASIDAAWKVVAAAGAEEEPARLRDRRLGLVLGRAVAHEVGHRLLGAGHRTHGLMRARISAAEFADLRDGGFGLDRLTAAAVPSARRLAAFSSPR